MSWINNALKLKHEEFQREVDNALKQTREALYSKFTYDSKLIFPNEESRQFFLQNNFRVDGAFTKEDIETIIEKSLAQNNIRLPFEFCVQNIYHFNILQSDGFQIADLHSDKQIELSPDDALRSHETLYLAIFEDKNAIIREMLWMIIASIVFTTIIVLAFFVTVRTLFNQKKLSEIKSDFISESFF